MSDDSKVTSIISVHRGVQIRKPETRGLLKIGRVFSNQKAANPWVSLKNKASLWPTRAQGGIYLVIYQHRLIVYQKNRIDLFFPILNFVLQDKCCIWQNRQKCDRNLRSFESIAFLTILPNTTPILQNKAKIRLTHRKNRTDCTKSVLDQWKRILSCARLSCFVHKSTLYISNLRLTKIQMIWSITSKMATFQTWEIVKFGNIGLSQKYGGP